MQRQNPTLADVNGEILIASNFTYARSQVECCDATIVKARDIETDAKLAFDEYVLVWFEGTKVAAVGISTAH